MGQAQIPVLNGATPAAPSGYQNARWQQGSSLGPDPTYGVPQIPDSCYVPNTGIAVVKTSNYTLSIADMGKTIIANSSGAITFTLPNPVPLNALGSPTTETRWNVRIANIGTGALTLAHNSLTIDGLASDLTIAQFSGTEVSTDGTNYFTVRGNYVPRSTLLLSSAVAGQPGGGQNVLIFTAPQAFTFPGNFSSPNSYGSVGTNPTATATYTVNKTSGGTTTGVGTIAISTSGVFTFATTSGASFSLAAGDRLTVVAPGTADATLADVSFTLVATT